MRKANKIILLSLLICSFTGIAQQEFSKWYFGGLAGLDFSTSPPTLLTNSGMNASEGSASISDNAGNLLFYAGTTGIWNSTHTAMANGTGLFGNPTSTQSDIIVKQPGSNTIYYVFTTQAIGSSGGTNYSIVDMSLAAGLGSVTVKNAPLYTPTCEKQVAVRHCNGKDVWIISHHYGSDQFRAYLLTSSGVSSSPVVSAVGGTISNSSGYAGHLKISPDGKKLAMATWSASAPASIGSGGFQLFDFDPASGMVSNPLTLLSATNIPNSYAYGVEFSPDGTKLYGTTSVFSSTNTSGIYQWDICSTNTAAIISSQYSISTGTLGLGSVQWAIDGKLYIAASGSQSLSVINNPNMSGAAMNLVLNALSLAPKYSNNGLPNFINNYTKPPLPPISNSIACQSVSFSTPTIPSYSSSCSSSPAYVVNGYQWDFGEPGSGAANTSTLNNPAHTYTTLGTYTVSLVLYSNCTNDTIKKVITISTQGPTPAISGPTEICKGDKITYTVSGGTSYKWFNNSTASTIALAPTTTTVYSVAATKNSCTLSKSFTVTINPCLGITTQEKADNFHIFPNPFQDVISIETISASELFIYELSGKLVLKTKLNSGTNQIDTSTLNPGVYFIQAKDAETVWRGRFVKME